MEDMKATRKEERNKVQVGEFVERGGALAAGRAAESRAIRVLSGPWHLEMPRRGLLTAASLSVAQPV